MHAQNEPAHGAGAQTQEPEIPTPVAEAAVAPERIGRYRVEKLLGTGSYGTVYLARDEGRGLLVAIKVLHREIAATPEDVEAYLAAARVLMTLQHPGIVPTYDADRTADGSCYVVSKYIDGWDLARKLKLVRPTHSEAAELVAQLAEALHYAHTQGLVHRDIKPANIVIDRGGKAHVGDYELALRHEHFGRGPAFVGSPSYMSPEQARHESHLVDGRSDIFSLGVVFYEMLTGTRPFQGADQAELIERIKSVEARPPRQFDDAIPWELERICLKALAKRASDRYTTAMDMADDLRHFLSSPHTDSTQSMKIVPKGLRSFDTRDADLFIELLPGPRNRDGLPDNIRLWKTRLEETDPDKTFRVGVIYGPSGGGKSSFVKAGLVPRLAVNVHTVYVEATASHTEERLLRGLRLCQPGFPADLGLSETLAALRDRRGSAGQEKVLIVLDQFEQWLDAHHAEDAADVVEALRQCDGEHVQCVLIVRDDFWMALTRFMRELEIELVTGWNIATLDLFGPKHAKRVLAAFGRALGTLPDLPATLSAPQESFLDQAVAGLVQDGTVIPVRLALFTEMVKGKPWTSETLKHFGGIEGVRIAFLEETFGPRSSHPAHRLHQQAARAVLKALLPEHGTDILGHTRSYSELLAASGHVHETGRFEELLRILDNEFRLITPVEPDALTPDAVAAGNGAAARPVEKQYQLTHDYIVPALRDWLTRKQRETRRGRAELRLAERSAAWNAHPEPRHLPTLREWLLILYFVRRRGRTEPQTRMMQAAARFHVLRTSLMLGLLAVIAGSVFHIRDGFVEEHRAKYAAGLVRRLLDAEIGHVPDVVRELPEYRRWVDPELRSILQRSAPRSREQLYASLALLPVDDAQSDALYGQLLDAEPTHFLVIREALLDRKDRFVELLWSVVASRRRSPQIIRAACALAKYDTRNNRWNSVSGDVAVRLVAQNPLAAGAWTEALRPVKRRLVAPLAAIFRDRDPEKSAERILATDVLADYAADSPDLLVELLQDADARQLVVLFPKLEAERELAVTLLEAELDREPVAGASDDALDAVARRQANAAVALLRFGRAGKVWPLLRHSPDPRRETYLVHRLCLLAGNPQIVYERLRSEQDDAVRRALILSLGEVARERLTSVVQDTMIGPLLAMYRDDPAPGIHGALEWLIRQCGQQSQLREIDRQLATGRAEGDRQWYLTRQQQTMVIVPGPVEFLIGSPPTEVGRESDETRHLRRIGRSFAIAAREVTTAEFGRFLEETPAIVHSTGTEYNPEPDCPQTSITWFQAAAYCNWLSRKEGLPEDQRCYLPNSAGEFAAGMKLAPGYLARTGYRLPTESEWVCACRAGTLTSRYYGQSNELLAKYAWYDRNAKDRTWPVAGLKPNPLGIFDMLGNVWEWCQERYQPFVPGENGAPVEDREDTLEVDPVESRVIRGGSFKSPAVNVRSANRLMNPPSYQSYSYGFRVARTVQWPE